MQKIKDIYIHLNGKFVERTDIIKGMLTSLIAGQHMLLIGPPGTAKSELVGELAKCINGGNYFHWLLSQFSTPDELFGPVSLQKLEQGVYERVTQNKLPEAHIAFADEIFKANSAILNNLLTIINERLFHNNGQPVKVPLVTLFGASNEYPEEENLEALFDRFILRYEIKPISEDNSTAAPELTIDELKQIQVDASKLIVDKNIFELYTQLKVELEEEGVNPSDRRWKQSIKVVKAAAAMRGANSVDPKDLNILKHILWMEPEQIKTVASIVAKHTVDKFTEMVEKLMSEAEEIAHNALQAASTEAGTEANKKLKGLAAEMKDIRKQFPSKENEIDTKVGVIKQKNQAVLNTCLGLE